MDVHPPIPSQLYSHYSIRPHLQLAFLVMVFSLRPHFSRLNLYPRLSQVCEKLLGEVWSTQRTGSGPVLDLLYLGIQEMSPIEYPYKVPLSTMTHVHLRASLENLFFHRPCPREAFNLLVIGLGQNVEKFFLKKVLKFLLEWTQEDQERCTFAASILRVEVCLY